MTTRTPDCSARRAAASHSVTTPGRKPEPAGEDSSTSRPPVSPYQPIAEPDSRTAGGVPAVASAPTRARVPRTRLARISSLYAAVQRRPATFAPARWTTASKPSRAPGASPPAAASGSQAISSALAGVRRTSLTTR